PLSNDPVWGFSHIDQDPGVIRDGRALPHALHNLRELRDGNGFDIPYPIYPEEKGLLPFGTTEYFNYLCWSRVGSPAKWPVVIWDADFLHRREFSKKGFVGFLLDVVTQSPDYWSIEECPFPFSSFDPPRRRFVPVSELRSMSS